MLSTRSVRSFIKILQIVGNNIYLKNKKNILIYYYKIDLCDILNYIIHFSCESTLSCGILIGYTSTYTFKRKKKFQLIIL